VAVAAAVVPEAVAVEEIGHPAVVKDPPHEGEAEEQAQGHEQALASQLKHCDHERQRSQMRQGLSQMDH